MNHISLISQKVAFIAFSIVLEAVVIQAVWLAAV
jgi:hypothetical protein